MPTAKKKTYDIEEMRKLWNEKGMSANEVAAAMGVSRNVVTGVAHRNGFAERPNLIKGPPAPKKVKPDGSVLRLEERRKAAAAAEEAKQRAAAVRPTGGFSSREGCQFPLWGAGPTEMVHSNKILVPRFCYAERVQASPYCPDHHTVCFVKIIDRRAKAP